VGVAPRHRPTRGRFELVGTAAKLF
jgi:hypothetical protein